MSLNAHEIRTQLIEATLEQALACEERFQTWPLDVQRQYQQKHEEAIGEWLQKLKPFGIEAANLVDAVNKYEELQRGWREAAILQRTDLDARFYRFLVSEETAEVSTYLTRENLVGKAESDYSVSQRAELHRIQNRWANLKARQLENGQ